MKLEEVPGFERLTSEQLGLLLHLPENDLRDLATLSPEDMKLVVLAYQQAATPEVKSGWGLFLEIVAAVVGVANVVFPVASAVGAVLGAVSAAKSL